MLLPKGTLPSINNHFYIPLGCKTRGIALFGLDVPDNILFGTSNSDIDVPIRSYYSNVLKFHPSSLSYKYYRRV